MSGKKMIEDGACRNERGILTLDSLLDLSYDGNDNDLAISLDHKRQSRVESHISGGGSIGVCGRLCGGSGMSLHASGGRERDGNELASLSLDRNANESFAVGPPGDLLQASINKKGNAGVLLKARDTIDDLSSELGEQKDKIRHLEKISRQQESTLLESQIALEKERERVKEMHESFCDNEIELTERMRRSDDQVEELRAVVQSLKQVLQERDLELSATKDEAEDYKCNLERETNQTTEMEGNLRICRRKIGDLEEDIRVIGKDRGDWKQKAEIVRGERDKLSQELIELKTESRAEIQILKGNIESLQTKLKAHGMQETAQMTEKRAMEVELHGLLEKNDRFKIEKEHLKIEVADMKKQLDKSVQETNEMRVALSRKNAQVEVYKKEIEDVTKERQDAHDKWFSLSLRHEEVECRTKSNGETFEEKIAEFSRVRKEQSEEIALLQQQLEKERSDWDMRLEKNIEGTREQMKIVKDEMGVIREAMTTLQKRLVLAEQEKKLCMDRKVEAEFQLRLRVEKAYKDKGELTRENSLLREENAKIASNCEKLEQRNLELKCLHNIMVKNHESEGLEQKARVEVLNTNFRSRLKEQTTKLQLRYDTKISKLQQQLAEKDFYVNKLRKQFVSSSPEKLHN